MTATEIQRYLSAVFDIELNIYVQQKALARMNETYSRLGISQKLYKPQLKTAESDTFFIMGFVGVIFGLIIGIVHAVIEYCSSSGFFSGIFYAIIALVAYGVMGVLVGGFTIGIAVAIYMKKSKQKELDAQYSRALARYEKNRKADGSRVDREQRQKQALKREMQRMQDGLERSKRHLRDLYGYNIINRDYQNIYAVSSLYNYFVNGRTQSLGFDAATGDQGAYNIYENERRMNRIITNTEEILHKFDMVMQNQYVLANGLREAEQKIDELCVGVNRFMVSTQNSLQGIEQCQAITAYNTARAAQELEFIAWMQMFR